MLYVRLYRRNVFRQLGGARCQWGVLGSVAIWLKTRHLAPRYLAAIPLYSLHLASLLSFGMATEERARIADQAVDGPNGEAHHAIVDITSQVDCPCRILFEAYVLILLLCTEYLLAERSIQPPPD